MDDVEIKSAAVDIFCYIVEFSPATVREFMVREARQQDDVSVWCVIFAIHVFAASKHDGSIVFSIVALSARQLMNCCT